MRTPTDSAAAWAWWEDAISGRAPDVREDDPQPGFFKVRRFRYGEYPRGPFVPARIWLVPGEIDPETGELMTDEILRAEIDGRATDPMKTWTWLSARPITMEEWEWLKAISPLTPKKIPA